MKIAFSLLVYFSLNFSLQAAATNYMTFIGGGGEPLDAVNTQFDLSLSNFSHFAEENKKNYNITINFNGGHADTDQMIKNRFKSSKVVENFTRDNYNKMIDDYINLLSSGQIPEDGKILIFINSHGGESKGNTHEISLAKSAMTNMNTGSKNGMVSLDALARLSELAEKKNVKLAIIDASCHSGNSIKLGNSKTCVITGSAPNLYAYSVFAENFASQMMKGKNLEDIFMSTRESIGGNGFPMISTPEGIQIQEELYSTLYPYLFFHDDYRGAEMDKIDSYLKGQAGTENSCQRELSYTQLSTLLNLIENVSAAQSFLGRKVNLNELRKSIANYKKVQEDYIKKLSELNLKNLKKVEPITLANGSRSPGYTHEQLIATDWIKYINEKNNDLKGDLPIARKKSLEESRDIFIKAQEHKERILKENPSYLQYQAILESMKKDANLSIAISSGIAKEAQKAYAAYYKYLSHKKSEGGKSATNACKDFVL